MAQVRLIRGDRRWLGSGGDAGEPLVGDPSAERDPGGFDIGAGVDAGDKFRAGSFSIGPAGVSAVPLLAAVAFECFVDVDNDVPPVRLLTGLGGVGAYGCVRARVTSERAAGVKPVSNMNAVSGSVQETTTRLRSAHPLVRAA